MSNGGAWYCSGLAFAQGLSLVNGALPARVRLDERNTAGAPGAAASARMDLDEADRAPDLELNEIIWKAVRGAGAAMPPPRRAAFVRPLDRDE